MGAAMPAILQPEIPATLGEMRRQLCFRLNGEEIRLRDIRPDTTLLGWLREQRRLTGSKEGCAEGDCGACTVVIAQLTETGQQTAQPLETGGAGHNLARQVSWQAVNACILLLPMLDGASITTIEGLAGPDGSLHPCQQAMVDCHGSQCGFCTPGFVMALYAGWRQRRVFDRRQTEDWLAGNLCRCTGYGPILKAASSLDSYPGPDWDKARAEAETAWLEQQAGDASMLAITSPGQAFFAPRRPEDFAALLEANPSAQIIAGATDIGLWITKQLRQLPLLVSIAKVAGLASISITDREIIIGAAVSHGHAATALQGKWPDLDELWRRFGSVQVRNSGTIGGNIANGSPIGDLAPALIALGSKLQLCRGTRRRVIALEDFFLDYGLQDRQPGEFLEALILPAASTVPPLHCYKVSKRFDQDISAVMGAFVLDHDGTIVSKARIAFGGMAATPKRASATEAAVCGMRLDDAAALDAAVAILETEFEPISDMRAKAGYRRRLAGNLLRKAVLESRSGIRLRLAGCISGLDDTSREAG